MAQPDKQQPNDAHNQVIVIRPPGPLASLHLREVWSYRGMIVARIKQQLRSTYDEMLLSFFWAVARPLIMVTVFVFVRGLADAKTGVTIPYPLYVYCGLVFWFYFAEATNQVAKGLRGDRSLVQKIYFPKLISPIVRLGSSVYSLALAALPMVVMMIIYKEWPGYYLALLPLALLQLFVLTFGVGLVFSALIDLSRDWERTMTFLLWMGMWMSPVIYDASRIPEKYRWIYELNPMVGTLNALRATLFAHYEFPWESFAYTSGLSIVFLVVGVLLFLRTERNIADRI